jgi:signal transduction histidine kinase
MHFSAWKTIRGRLVLAALMVELVMLAILVGNSQRLLREAMGDQAREQADQIAPVLSAALVAPLAQYDYATVQAVLNESHAIRGISYLAVADASGTIVATSGWPANTPLPAIDEKFNLDDDPPRYDLAQPIALAGQKLGKLQLGLDLTRIVVARKNLLSQGVVIAAGEMLLSLGLLWSIGHLITRQLSQLTQAAMAVADGKTVRVQVPEGGDDVGQLGAAFNVMSRSIADRVAELTRASADNAHIAASLQDKNTQLEQSHAALRDENAMRLEAQQALEFALSRIRDRTEQLNAIFDVSPDGFVSFDARGRLTYASPGFLQMTSLASREVIGLGEARFSVLLSSRCIEDAPFVGVAALRQSFAVEAAANAEPGRARTRHLIELAGTPKRVLEVGWRQSDAETVSQILFFRDVTHETEVDRMKSEFLSHAAHELRTPMASIFGFANLLRMRKYPEEKQQELLGIISRQSQLMVSIINELLDLARIDDRRGQDFDFGRHELAALVREVVADLGVPEGRQPVSMQLPASDVLVRADKMKLMQAVRNILSNAYKYSPQGGQVTLSLVHETAADGVPRVGVRVVDQGIGMTPEQTARVSERFYRADTSGNIPGTGLGMSIVKEIITIHGGSMDIASQAGQGTTVTLWLPLQPEPDRARPGQRVLEQV